MSWDGGGSPTPRVSSLHQRGMPRDNKSSSLGSEQQMPIAKSVFIYLIPFRLH